MSLEHGDLTAGEVAARLSSAMEAGDIEAAAELARLFQELQDRPRLIWTIGTENRKNPNKLVGMPVAHVGPTREHARASCAGCKWLDAGCYAHEGRVNAVGGKIERGNAGRTLEGALAGALWARTIRITAIGDVGGVVTVDRAEVHDAIKVARGRRLAVVGYTHFWERPENQDLRADLMASVEAREDRTELERADDAVDAGWRPAAVLADATLTPLIEEMTGKPKVGSRVTTPKGRVLLVCPFNTKLTRCNDCRLCDPQHPAWGADKVHGIAFVEHGPHITRGKALPVAKP